MKTRLTLFTLIAISGFGLSHTEAHAAKRRRPVAAAVPALKDPFTAFNERLARRKVRFELATVAKIMEVTKLYTEKNQPTLILDQMGLSACVIKHLGEPATPEIMDTFVAARKNASAKQGCKQIYGSYAEQTIICCTTAGISYKESPLLRIHMNMRGAYVDGQNVMILTADKACIQKTNAPHLEKLKRMAENISQYLEKGSFNAKYPVVVRLSSTDGKSVGALSRREIFFSMPTAWVLIPEGTYDGMFDYIMKQEFLPALDATQK
jgi:hypothetical protein